MTNGHKIRCEAVERGSRCRSRARMRCFVGSCIVYSCLKPHVQWAHLKGRWEVEMLRGWDKEPRRTTGE